MSSFVRNKKAELPSLKGNPAIYKKIQGFPFISFDGFGFFYELLLLMLFIKTYSTVWYASRCPMDSGRRL